jgi:hypothetical protein
MTPSVVERADLERANGWLVGGTTVMQGMIAGPFGGFLFVLAACLPFVVNAGTYAVSAVLVGLLNVTLTATTSVLVLLASERLHLGAVGYGALFTCEAAGARSACTARCGPSWAARCGSG